MNTAELASLIVDAQESFDPDDMIAISAMPDHLLIRSYYCDPHSNVSLLKDYTDQQLDGLFAECKDLAAATAKVSMLSAGKPLTKDECRLARTLVLNATLNAVLQIADGRKLVHNRTALEAITTLVVCDLQSYISTFHK